MKKKLKLLTRQEVKMVKTPALAEKHNCSDVYVRCVLIGSRAAKSPLALMILKDANDILGVLDRDTSLLIKKKR